MMTVQPMLYPELFRSLEAVRWNMATDVPWDSFEADKLSEEQAQTIRMNAITEWAALPEARPRTEPVPRRRGEKLRPLAEEVTLLAILS